MQEIPATSPEEKRMKTKKKKLEEKILSRSKRFIKITETESPELNDSLTSTITPKPSKKSLKRPLEVQAAEEGQGHALNPESPEVPPLKRKKPRHASVEGQLFLKAKEKAQLRELEGSVYKVSVSAKGNKSGKGSTTTTAEESTNSSTNPKAKKTKKKKRNKKKKPDQDEEAKNNKHLESEERQRKEALAYLQLWKKHRDHWKFEKLKQVWLLKHALFHLAIDDNCFETLVEYIESIKGAARQTTMKEMEGFMYEFEKKFGKSDRNSVFSSLHQKQKEPEEGERKEYDRARQIVQTLADA